MEDAKDLDAYEDFRSRVDAWQREAVRRLVALNERLERDNLKRSAAPPEKQGPHPDGGNYEQ